MTTSVAFVGYSWNEQYALDDMGVKWEFDVLLDIDRDIIITTEDNPACQEDVEIIVVKHPDNDIWAEIVLSEFEDATLN